MLERLQFLVVYVGSAAMAAFLAACLSSPQVATLPAAAPGADAMNPERVAAEVPTQISVAAAGGD